MIPFPVQARYSRFVGLYGRVKCGIGGPVYVLEWRIATTQGLPLVLTDGETHGTIIETTDFRRYCAAVSEARARLAEARRERRRAS